MKTRRQLLEAGAVGSAASLFPPGILKALAIPAATSAGTVQDIQHIVILMMENRSFDHYFGSLRGMRGFGDRHPVPLESGKPVWFQSDGAAEIPPFHLDTATTAAMRVPGTPHSYPDAQAAWNQGKFGFWPKYKTRYSMGHYRRADLPYQFALAEAFTLCDAYHCSIATGTDPNRIVLMSGTNADPVARARGENATAANAEVVNVRCAVTGNLPEPGYAYSGSAFTWATIPEVLEEAGISWRIYQDPNDNYDGLMHGCLAFESFRRARPGSPLYEKGMRGGFLDRLAQDARTGALPQVSWVLPSALWSEHPGPSSPAQGAEFTARVLAALTDNPDIWSRTALILTFDENDGMFDHMPPPAPPSYNLDGTLAGGATLDLKGLYFSDEARSHLAPDDIISGTVRPWGLGARVPAYVISPWSRGGWVNSQVFDHTSVGQLLERRFGVTVPGISPWHRAVCGDLLSAFDFVSPNDPAMPVLPDTNGSAALVAEQQKRPRPEPPATPEKLFQEKGPRRSRALPYDLQVDARMEGKSAKAILTFHNNGGAGAVFHVYDKLRPDRIPRRYTVEAGKQLEDEWTGTGGHHLWILGPGGFLREFKGRIGGIELLLRHDTENRRLTITIVNRCTAPENLVLRANAYHQARAPVRVTLAGWKQKLLCWDVSDSANWYDLTLAAAAATWRFAGRLENGRHGISDPHIQL